MRTFLTLISALAALMALPAAAAPALQPGMYALSMQMVMKGMPVQMPVMTLRRCLTAADIANGNAYASGEKNQACTVSNLRNSGGTLSYAFSCPMEGNRRMVGEASGSSHATGYDVMMNGRFVPPMEGLTEFNQKMSAKRIGDCR